MDPTLNSAKISVLMPVYNGEKYLREAIDSILQQTCNDFELLVINDGSTDASEKIILSYKDERIVYVKNDQNLGLIDSLNKGLKLCKGEFIARMDADDIAMPGRLKKQLEFMESNKEYGLVASNYINFSESFSKNLTGPETNDEIRTNLLFACCLCHPSVLIRKRILDENNLLYNKAFKHVEDYELWTKMAAVTRLHNLQAMLLKYRYHQSQVSLENREVQLNTSDKVRRNFLEAMGFVFSQEQLVVHDLIGSNRLIRKRSDLLKAADWLYILVKQNEKIKFAETSAFNKVIAKYWLDTCGNTSLGVFAFRTYFGSPLTQLRSLSFSEKLKLFGKCLLRYFRK